MPKDCRGGFPTYWTQLGQGPRPALLLHCSLAHSGAWGGFAAELDDFLRMTAFDLPGHGRSAALPEEAEIQSLAMAMALDLLDGPVVSDLSEGPVDLIGHSFGATVALRLAIQHPEKVRSLTLIEPPFVSVIKADHPGLELADDHVMAVYARAIAAGDHEKAARVFTAEWGDGRPWDSLRETTRATMVAQIHLIGAQNPALREDVGKMLRPGVLEALDIPVLLLEGGDSPKEVGMIQDGLERRLPDTRRKVIAGAGHMVPITHAREVALEVRGFLQSLGSDHPG